MQSRLEEDWNEIVGLRFQLSVRVVQLTRASLSTCQLGRRQPSDSDEVLRGGDQLVPYGGGLPEDGGGRLG